jgi:hypothetical protein
VNRFGTVRYLCVDSCESVASMAGERTSER